MPNVILSVLKQGEGGGGLVLRGYETHGKATTVHVLLPMLDKQVPIAFGPYELKTVVIDPAQWVPVAANLLEEALAGT